MASVTMLCELWFAPSERATATAVAVESNVLGATVAFIAGPLMVTQDAPTQAQVDAYNAIYVAVCGANLLAACAYFPLLPAAPPSISASFREKQQTDEAAALAARARGGGGGGGDATAAGGGGGISLLWRFWLEHVALARNLRFMLLCVAAGFLNGAFSAWSSTLSLSGASFGIDNVAAGWIGAIQAFAGNFTGIAACMLVDRCRVAPKTIILASTYACFALFLCYVLQTQGYWPAAASAGEGGTAALWVFASASGVALNTAWPVFVDASADEGFPVPEATSLTLLTNVYNFVTLVFLFIPAEGNAFVWCIVAGIIVNIAALHIFYKPGLARRQVDDGLIDPDAYAAAAADDGKKLPTDGAGAALLGGAGGAGFDDMGIQ